MPVTSARMLVDAYARQGVRVLVVHDLDRSGAAIAHTLGHDTRRYRFSADPNVIDLGLSLAEAREMGLQDEAAQGQGPGEERLREYGLDEEEIDFLIRQGRRVELNAMTSDELVAWLEGKLREHGAGKVVPEAGVLDRHARRLLARRRMADAVRPLIEAAEAEAAEASLPDDLAERVRERQEDDPALPWEDALEAAVTETVSHPPQVGQQADDGDGGSEP